MPSGLPTFSIADRCATMPRDWGSTSSTINDVQGRLGIGFARQHGTKMTDTRVCPACGTRSSDTESCLRCGRDLSTVTPATDRVADWQAVAAAALNISSFVMFGLTFPFPRDSETWLLNGALANILAMFFWIGFRSTAPEQNGCASAIGVAMSLFFALVLYALAGL